MKPGNIKILGISGSPRDEGTAYAVKMALAAAAEMDGVETEYISLRKKDINACTFCHECRNYYKEHPNCRSYYCSQKDAMQEIIPSFLEADGYIIGSPVYDATISGVLRCFFERTQPLKYFAADRFRYRVGTMLAVGGGRNAGQEFALVTIRNFYLYHGMLACGVVGDFKYGVPFWSDDGGAAGVAQDTYAMEKIGMLGGWLAERTMIFKLGCEMSAGQETTL